ncbi:MAG: toll/interleukin-1 receptor domain-containing protein [Candidatus Methanoperedens sp.]|nr:toll/interleukin-1 receptor domain-containing protein [Candidatus Methanoperedens sp.]
MSHIFISYAHSDKAHLDRLVAWLHHNEFDARQIWYDQHIEGGNNWRDEITTALDEAFVVLVIVTSNSVKSLYCTFEWAYAMGQGIPILPFTFDNVSIADVPSPLTSKQFINCTANIPDYLKEQINRFKSVPPQVAAINKLIYETIYDTHRRFFILGKIENILRYSDTGLVEELMSYFIDGASDARQALQILMTDKAFAFTNKQHRFCWTLIDFLQEFSRLHNKLETYFYDRLFSQFDSSWLPAFEYFEGDGFWRRFRRSYFDRDLEDEDNKMQVFAEMVRAFPELQVIDVNELIQNLAIDQQEHKT